MLSSHIQLGRMQAQAHSDGWSSVYHHDTHELQVWRNERTIPWIPEPQRGVFRLHTRLPLDRKVRSAPVYALHYPTLSYTTNTTTLVDMNVDTLQTEEHLVGMPGRAARVHSLDSTAQWVARVKHTTARRWRRHFRSICGPARRLRGARSGTSGSGRHCTIAYRWTTRPSFS